MLMEGALMVGTDITPTFYIESEKIKRIKSTETQRHRCLNTWPQRSTDSKSVPKKTGNIPTTHRDKPELTSTPLLLRHAVIKALTWFYTPQLNVASQVTEKSKVTVKIHFIPFWFTKILNAWAEYISITVFRHLIRILAIIRAVKWQHRTLW